jgi:hypothetical protein
MWNTLARMLFGQLGPLLRAIWGALRDQQVFELALTLAEGEVARLEADPKMPGDTKRKVAFDAIWAALKQAGKALEPYLIDLAIALALAALRAQMDGTLGAQRRR